MVAIVQLENVTQQLGVIVNIQHTNLEFECGIISWFWLTACMVHVCV